MRSFILTVSLLCTTSCWAQTRIACGRSTPYTDSTGNVWQADADFVGGGSFAVTSTITGTANSALFDSLRFGVFSYTIPVPNGTYNVNLEFAETWNGAFAKGVRVFGMNLNGAAVLTNFDVFAKVGANTADIETFPVTVTTGSIIIQSVSETQNPILNAIDIEPATQLPSVTWTINPGSTALFDDGTPILASTGVVINQTGATAQAGSIASDANGNLSGSITVNPNLADSNGNITLTFGLSLFPNVLSYPVPVMEFEQGETGLTLNLVLFKKALMVKSQMIALTP